MGLMFCQFIKNNIMGDLDNLVELRLYNSQTIFLEQLFAFYEIYYMMRFSDIITLDLNQKYANYIKTKKNMENQQPKIPYDETSQSTQPQHSKQQKNKQKSRIYQCDWFPITTSPWIASIAFLFLFLLPIHMIDSYGDNAGKVFNNNQSFKIISPFVIDGIQSVAYAFCTLLSVVSVLTLFFNKCQQQEGYKYLLGWIGSKMFPVLRYIIDINLAIAAIFMIRTPTLASLFAIASLINIIISFFCQNYNLRKDYLCCKSMPYMMMWKVSVIITYALSCTCYYLVDSTISLMIFLILQFIIMSALFIAYFVFGFLIYRHSSTQIVMLIVLNCFCSVAAGNLYDAFVSITTGKFAANRNCIIAAYFAVVLGLLMYSLWSSVKKNGTDLESKDLIRKVYFIFNKIQNSSQNISDDCQIRGIIRYHMSHTCKNQNCFVNKDTQNYYDAKKNKFCFPHKINQGKISFVKFIAKCLYEQELEKNKWESTDLLLDYIEFYYMKLKNLFQVSKLLVQLEKKFLTPFQKLRLTRLRRVMLEQNRKLNEELYNGSLDLENLIASETKFDEIQLQIKELQVRNIQFWRYIENYSVNLSVMIKMLKPNFQLVQKINNNWKCIANYFQIQKIWKFMFACYTLYFRNEKLKPQLIQEFGQSVHEEQLFSYESLHIDKTTQPSKLYVSKMIFEPDVCCIHITHDEEKPIIKSVSRYFQRMFGYQPNQVIESCLDIMMSPCFRAFHKKNFLRWAGQGMSNKQNNYEVKKIFPLQKNGYIVSVFKFYKQFLCLDKQLQYVGMLKKNKEEQCVIILNQDYEIQAMTESLASKLSLTYKQYQQLIGLNILCMIPSLIEYTKFEKQKQKMSENMVNQLMAGNKTTVTHEFSQKSKTKKSSINQKKQLTKSNLHLSIPGCIKQAKQAYHSSHFSNDLQQNILARIFKASKVIKQNQNRKKFKVQIQARLINIMEQHSYLELYVREIESAEKNQKKDSVVDYVRKQDKRIQEVDSASVKEEEFNKFFQNSHSSQNISLSFNDNIFIKEDNNQPVQMISYVKSITLYVRILSVLFFAFLISSLLFEFNNYEGYKTSSQKTFSMVQLQLKVMMLDNHYYSQFLGIAGAKQTITQLSTSLRQLRQSNLEFKKSILDPTINQYQTYTYLTQSGPSTNDQIDIVDKLFQKIIQNLYFYNLNNTLTQNSVMQFTSIAVPSIQILTTNARNKISQYFNIMYGNIEVKNYVFLGLGMLLLVLGLLGVLSRLVRISGSFVSLVEIFTQFSQADLKRIIRYYVNLDSLFNHLCKKYDLLKLKQSNSQLQIEAYHNQNSSNNSYSFKNSTNQQDAIINDENHQQDNANLNKKVKKVVIGKQLTNLKIRPIIYVVIFLLTYGMSSFGLNLYTLIINKSIIEYKNAGQQIFQYYSSINLYFLSMKDRAVKKQQFNVDFYKQYSDRLSQMKKLQYKDQAKVYGEFVKIRNSVIFGNVCQLYSNVYEDVGYTKDQCKNIVQNNFQHGLQSFLFYMIGNVDFYRDSATYDLDPDLVSDLEKGMQICNLFLGFLLQKWLQIFISLSDMLQRNIIIICSSLLFVQIVIYILFIEVLIVGNLKQKFIFFRKIYNNMMPDFIVTKQKIIKAKLQVQGFIKK